MASQQALLQKLDASINASNKRFGKSKLNPPRPMPTSYLELVSSLDLGE